MKLISVWSPKGGVGKTTLTLALAAALTRRKYTVGVYDLDPQKSAKDVAQQGRLPFEVFASDEGGDPADFVLFDHPPGMTEDALPPAEAHAIVVPLRPAYLDLASLSRAMPLLRGREVIPVFNAWDPRRQEHVELARQYPTWPCVSNRSVFERMIKHGITLFDPLAESWYGGRPSRDQIERVLDIILYKTQGVVPAVPKTKEELMALAHEDVEPCLASR